MFHRSPFPIVSLLILILLLPLAGCAEGQQLGQFTIESQQSNLLVFSGVVEDAAQTEWLNGYTVILFKNDQELRRVETKLDEFTPSGVGKQDGYFKFELPNQYALSPEHVTLKDGIEFNLDANGADGQPTGQVYHWFGPLRPGDLIRLDVPQKRISYTIHVMSVPTAEMGDGLQAPGSAQLVNGAVVAKTSQTAQVSSAPAAESVVDTNIGGGAPLPTPERIVSTVSETAVSWKHTLTNFHGNRWEVWENYVQPRNPGLTWEQFKDDVLLHNPQLVTDGYVFHAHKRYLIP